MMLVLLNIQVYYNNYKQNKISKTSILQVRGLFFPIPLNSCSAYQDGSLTFFYPY